MSELIERAKDATEKALGSGDHDQTGRDVFRTKDSKSIEIVHRAKISPKWRAFLRCFGWLHPASCVLCKLDFIFKSTYVQIHENRVETNYVANPSLWNIAENWDKTYLHPTRIFSCSGAADNVRVFYFDEVGSHAARARCCFPMCTHCQPCPTCCDACGEGVVLYTDECCCRDWVLLSGLENAEEFLAAYRQAKRAHKELQRSAKEASAKAIPTPAAATAANSSGQPAVYQVPQEIGYQPPTEATAPAATLAMASSYQIGLPPATVSMTS